MNVPELINTARMLTTGDKGLLEIEMKSMTTGIRQLMKPAS